MVKKWGARATSIIAGLFGFFAYMTLFFVGFHPFGWRRHPDLNWGIRVLQTLALPLGYVTIKKKTPYLGADDEARTRYLHLGKVALYQMSYVRIWCLRSESNQRHGDFQSPALPTELQRHNGDPDGLEPSTSSVTG